jgi:hypothetical protein
MLDYFFYAYAVALSIATIVSGIGVFSYIFLVIPYIWYMRFKDRDLWLSLGGPWLGVGLFEILNVLAFLWKKQYETSEVRSIIVLSNILRVIYVKFIVLGIVGLLIVFFIGDQYPHLHEQLRIYTADQRVTNNK